MTNFEYYKDKVLNEPVKNNCPLSIPFIGSKVADCTKCNFFNNNTGGCDVMKFWRWMYSEHVEHPTLTSKERKLLEVIETGYIARDANGALWWYAKEPLKGRRTWLFEDCDGDHGKLGYILDCFSFIKFKDEKPWKVEDLLKLEVME